jgi:hypothetical protein
MANTVLKKKITDVDSVFSGNEQGEVNRRNSNESCGCRSESGKAWEKRWVLRISFPTYSLHFWFQSGQSIDFVALVFMR